MISAYIERQVVVTSVLEIADMSVRHAQVAKSTRMMCKYQKYSFMMIASLRRNSMKNFFDSFRNVVVCHFSSLSSS